MKQKEVLIEGICYYCKTDCKPNYYFHPYCAKIRYDQSQIEKAFREATIYQTKAKVRLFNIKLGKGGKNKKNEN